MSIVVALAALSVLAGCSLFDAGPPRDDTGAITAAKTVPVPTLRVDDCFSFRADGTLDTVDAVPCSAEHTHIVIGKGAYTEQAIADGGGLQNAVSAGCSDSFEAFKAAAAEGTKPTQEFLVAEITEDDEELTGYWCVATDGAVQAAD